MRALKHRSFFRDGASTFEVDDEVRRRVAVKKGIKGIIELGKCDCCWYALDQDARKFVSILIIND